MLWGQVEMGSQRKLLGLARRLAALCFAAGLGGLAAAGCGAHTQRMRITISTDANNNSPVIFSVILPRNQAVFKKLLELTAKQWFAQREQLLRDYRNDIDEAYYEFVPGQQIPELTQKGGRGRLQGILFLNYQTPGAHRYTFDANQVLKLGFGQREVSFIP